MHTNIALHKSTFADNYVTPYEPSRAVDGVSAPFNRWVGSTPAGLEVDLGAEYMVNRWVVRQMGSVGWTDDYNLSDYKLQGMDGANNWFDLDVVVDNLAKETDRTFSPSKTRFVRVYVEKGLRCNPGVASIIDLEIYEYLGEPTSAKLTALTLKEVELNPAFINTTDHYTGHVCYGNSGTITVTPIAEDSRATIKVNGSSVISGATSEPITLKDGCWNNVTVEVTPDIGYPQNYTILVAKATSPYLTSVAFGESNVTIERNVFNYTVELLDCTEFEIIPTAEDANATIIIGGGYHSPKKVKSGLSLPYSVYSGETIYMMVTSAFGNERKTYSFKLICPRD